MDDHKSAETLLGELANAKAEMENLLALKERSVPAEVRQMLEDIQAEFQPKLDVIQTQIDELEEKVKEAVLQRGETVKGLRLSAVYIPPQSLWNDEKLQGYAAVHPEILELKKMSKPHVTIRKVVSKKPPV